MISFHLPVLAMFWYTVRSQSLATCEEMTIYSADATFGRVSLLGVVELKLVFHSQKLKWDIVKYNFVSGTWNGRRQSFF